MHKNNYRVSLCVILVNLLFLSVFSRPSNAVEMISYRASIPINESPLIEPSNAELTY
ncbi:hypothetical protein Xbed_01849 [Xenorhabdus beddingii]|uniref:Uncharacterized protein n=1 Tax=Xenorhabdus beddingii TaxID=40578 RepID=A0A1Y2SMF7_9GAMM|nr:hypothetical protein Xbed_01849 [Xenorhabdus beddingii]